MEATEALPTRSSATVEAPSSTTAEAKKVKEAAEEEARLAIARLVERNYGLRLHTTKNAIKINSTYNLN